MGGPPAHCSRTYERAIGYWDKFNEVASSVPALWDRNRNWSWHTFDDRCPVDDLLSDAANSLANAPSWFPAGGLRVLLIGDSLDKSIMTAFCELGEKRTAVRWLVHEGSGAGICRGAALTLVNYRIFGLANYSQPYLLPRYETRRPKPRVWDTRYRLQRLLPRDVPNASSFDAIILHSSAWDLSRPLTTTDPATVATARAYHAAVRNVSHLMRRSYPRSRIFWRTSPPLGFDDGPPIAGVTRTKKSQTMLHNALKDAVDEERRAGNVDGDVLDWHNMLGGYSHLAKKDPNRVHYPRQLGLAFFNLFLNALRARMQRPRAIASGDARNDQRARA